MTKWQFTEILKQKGYAVDETAAYPTVLLVGATKEKIKKKFIELKLFAQKIGYNHTIGVKNLEEDKDEYK